MKRLRFSVRGRSATRGATENPERRAGTVRFARFCVVGAIGFCVDAAVLLLCVHLAGWDAVTGRFASFAVAVLATFELNRTWAFGHARTQPYLIAFGTYIGVQGIGFLCNLSVYTILYLGLPPPLNAPLFCLVVASAVAMILNYTGACFVVFRDRSPT